MLCSFKLHESNLVSITATGSGRLAAPLRISWTGLEVQCLNEGSWTPTAVSVFITPLGRRSSGAAYLKLANRFSHAVVLIHLYHYHSIRSLCREHKHIRLEDSSAARVSFKHTLKT